MRHFSEEDILENKTHENRLSITGLTEIQIKTIVRNHRILTGRAEIKKY